MRFSGNPGLLIHPYLNTRSAGLFCFKFLSLKSRYLTILSPRPARLSLSSLLGFIFADIPSPFLGTGLLVTCISEFHSFLCKNDKKMKGQATSAAKLSPTRSLPIFAVYGTQQLSSANTAPALYLIRFIFRNVRFGPHAVM